MSGQIDQSVAMALIVGVGIGWVSRAYIRSLLDWMDLRLLPARHLKKCGERKRLNKERSSRDVK